jgi:hypothetical protein
MTWLGVLYYPVIQFVRCDRRFRQSFPADMSEVSASTVLRSIVNDVSGSRGTQLLLSYSCSAWGYLGSVRLRGLCVSHREDIRENSASNH